MTTRTETITRSETVARERTAWIVLAVLLLFSIAAPLNQFKIPPIMPILMGDLKLSIGGAGMLMSVYAVTGLLLALPSGLIFHRVGYKVTGVIAGAAMVLGAVLGALSTSTGMLLASRAIEGAGTCFMAVLAPAIIAQWFGPEKRGTALGVWSAWVPVGTAIMLVAAPALAEGLGWPSVWWFGAAYAALATVAYLAIVRPAPGRAAAQRSAGQRQSVYDAGELSSIGAAGAASAAPAHVLRNRNLWLLSAAFGCYCAAGIGLGSYLPTFLTTQRGLPLVQASLLASISTFISIASGPAGGILSDRIGSRKRPYLAGMVFLAIAWPVTGLLGLPALVVLIAMQGLIIGLVPTNIFSAAVEAIRDERQGGLAMAVIMVGQNAGMLLGPAIFGALVESAGGWPVAFASLAVMALLGIAAGWLARVR